eukprot:TRINITY_DN15481_c0_g1_i3.p1 TRINITY_DN15481_c0_g1~~TRINITY_DN15481_c0_g1_i3.p1  ORF type:complete len:231 (-),score=32.89 TRINITY_DN15481_c0_g1_i3:185-796(-)
MSPRIPTETGEKVIFSHKGGRHSSNSFQSLRIVFDFNHVSKGSTQNPDSVRLTFWLDNYIWSTLGTTHLIYIFNFTNSVDNHTVSISRPDRFQAVYGYITSPPFAESMIDNHSWIERIPARLSIPQQAVTGAMAVTWITFGKFGQSNLVHSIAVGFGLEDRPNLAVITGLTVSGIILLAFGVVVLIIFGRKIAKRYAHKYDTL